MSELQLSRYSTGEVAFLSCESSFKRVTSIFTEREGGVSAPPWSSLNLGSLCCDDLTHVRVNRARILKALGLEGLTGRIIAPRQTHSDKILTITAADDESLAQAQAISDEGFDAVVCTAPDVVVMLCFADCVPVILQTHDAFAVVHSGWRGTYAQIAEKSLHELCRVSGCAPDEVEVFIGPHIQVSDYEVSADLVNQFVASFGRSVSSDGVHLNLSEAICVPLLEAGVAHESILISDISTAQATDRFYSYRKEGPVCGRHAAIAHLRAQ